MNERDFKSLKVLLVTAKPHVAQVLRQVLNIAGVTDITPASDAASALTLLCTEMYDAVFVDDASSRDGRRDFGHMARRSDDLLDPMVPVFLVCAAARRRDVETARDQGYTDVLTRPVSAATIGRKLKLAMERPRPFIAAPNFFGPDRRSEARGQFRGDERRKRMPRKVKIPTATVEV